MVSRIGPFAFRRHFKYFLPELFEKSQGYKRINFRISVAVGGLYENLQKFNFLFL